MLAQMMSRKPANRYLAALLLLCRKRIMFGNALQRIDGDCLHYIKTAVSLPCQFKRPELQVNCLEVFEASLEPG